jgi:hypothetical protein
MDILEIYKKYQIMPQLGEHQLKVAGVADIICEHINPLPLHQSSDFGAGEAIPPHKGEGMDKHDVVAACLLHDMGNIVKFDLNQTQDLHPGLFVKPDDRLFWEKAKRQFIKKYGTGSHNVTAKIVKEIGVSPRIFELVDCIGFNLGAENTASDDFGKKICAYSDMRVMPKGICSLEDRMADLRARYKNHPEDERDRDVFEAALREIEKQIFERCDIKPKDITEASVAERKEKLKSFEI